MASREFRRLKYDMTGQRFGKLVVKHYNPQAYRAKNPKGHETWFGKWFCQCDCGQTIYKKTKELRSGFAKSCGCSRYVPDISGQKFHMLTAIRRDNTRKRNSVMWLCRCDCGQERIVSGYNLRAGLQKSCGCRKKSHLGSNEKQRAAKFKADQQRRKVKFETEVERFRNAKYGIEPLFTLEDFLKIKLPSNDQLPWRCLAQGHEFKRAWLATERRGRCPVCSYGHEKRKNILVRTRAELAPYGTLILDTEAQFLQLPSLRVAKVTFGCEKGHKFKRTLSRMRSAKIKSCPVCRKEEVLTRLDLETRRQLLFAETQAEMVRYGIFPNISRAEFIKIKDLRKTKMSWRCVHGHVFENTIYMMKRQNDKTCPVCVKTKSTMLTFDPTVPILPLGSCF